MKFLSAVIFLILSAVLTFADSTDFTIDTPCEKEFFVFTKTLEESLFSVAISRNILCDTSIKNYWDCFVAIPQKADGISVIKLLL